MRVGGLAGRCAQSRGCDGLRCELGLGARRQHHELSWLHLGWAFLSQSQFLFGTAVKFRR
ncbi:MAG: hypothetical protein AB7P40_29310 [Chloroflexota bacterium]